LFRHWAALIIAWPVNLEMDPPAVKRKQPEKQHWKPLASLWRREKAERYEHIHYDLTLGLLMKLLIFIDK
jgi:hypothetical protein